MTCSATIATGESYFVESYRQCFVFLGLPRRSQPIVAGAILAAGLAWLIYRPGFFPGILLFLGIGQFADFYRFRRFWINRYASRFGDDATGSAVVTAAGSGLTLDGIDDGGAVGWDAVTGVHSTPEGLSLSFRDREPIYIPSTSFDDAGFKKLVATRAAVHDRG